MKSNQDQTMCLSRYKNIPELAVQHHEMEFELVRAYLNPWGRRDIKLHNKFINIISETDSLNFPRT